MPTKLRIPYLRKDYPQPIPCTRGVMMAATTAAAGLCKMLPKEKPRRLAGQDKVQKALNATNIQDIPNPTEIYNNQHEGLQGFNGHIYRPG
jgi:hypothetical protein